MSTIKIKIIGTVPGQVAGTVVDIHVDNHGNPLVKFWRDRLLDAKTDGCIEIVKPSSKNPHVEKESSKEIK